MLTGVLLVCTELTTAVGPLERTCVELVATAVDAAIVDGTLDDAIDVVGTDEAAELSTCVDVS